MRVALITHTFFPEFVAGREKHVKMLAEHLSRNDEVFVITGSENPRVERSNYTAHYLPMFSLPVSHNPKQYYRVVRNVYSTLKKINPEVVHAHELDHFTSFIACVYSFFNKKKLFVTCHGYYDETLLIKLGLAVYRRVFGRIIARQARNIFIVSEEQENALKNIKNLVLIPNGVEFSNMTRKINGQYILSVGRLMNNKNHKSLINAFSLLQEEFPDLKLFIVGEDMGALPELKKLSSELGLTKRIFFLGKVVGNKIEELFLNSSVFVNCSFNEGMPLSVLEAAAAKVPVLCTPFKSIKGVFGKNYPFFINPYSTEDIAEKLRLALLQDNTASISETYSRIKSLNWKNITKKIRGYYG